MGKGWLDNYGKKENPNESSVSLPEGFVGMGNNTKGRNYSPAWGGQFEDGGLIPNAQKGKKVKPIYVESKNDPRYRAYQDSLSDYKWSSEILNKVLKDKKSPNKKPIDITKIVDKTPKQILSERISRYNKLGISPSIVKQDMIETDPMNKGTNKRNRAISYKQFPYVGQDKSLGSFDLAQYKKPQQPVIVKPTVQPRVEALNLQPIQQAPINLPFQEIDTRPRFVKPKSFNIRSQRQTMSGPSDYYNYTKEGATEEEIMRVIEAAKAYNADVERRYGNEEALKNPKAVKRLKQLKQDVEVTPVYQMGGYVYPVNYVPKAQMGGSIPGSVGFTYARTKGIPSEGPYAKKTMPSAQEGKTITIDEGDGKTRKILTDSKEYADLFNQGKIGVKNDDESISFNPLNEVVVTPYDKQYPFYQELSDEEKKYFNSDSPIGRQLRSRAQDNVGFNADKAADFAYGWLRDIPLASLQAPQSALVEGVEAIRGNDFNMLNALDPSTQRIPSETWEVENPYAAFAVDAFTDPETLMGMSLLKNPLQKGLKQLGNIKTSIDPELRQGLYEQGLFDFFKRKPKSNYSNYRLVTDEDLPISSFNKASKEQIKTIQENNIYKDLAKSESRRHQDLMRDIEEYGEGWKYTDEEIANSVKQAADAKKNWSNYIEAAEAEIKTNPKFFDDTKDNLVFYKGKGLGKEELQQLAKQEPDQWYGIQGYKETRPNVKGYISDEADYIHDTKFRLPGNRFDTEAMLRDMGKDAANSFNKMYKNQNWKPNIKDIPLNKDGGIIKDDMGQWAHPGEITEINSNDITMQGVPYPVLGISDTGDTKLMQPGKDYKFKGKKVTEFPMAKNGLRQEQKGLVNLDQLTNFTNYNTKQPGGWLDKY